MQQQQRSMFQNGKDGLNVGYLLLACYCMCFLPLLRCRRGIESLGIPAAAAFIILLFVSPDPLLGAYLWIWVIAVIVRRVEAEQLYRQGEGIHSLYQGDSELKCLPEHLAKIVGEPLLAATAGVVLKIWSHSAGVFFLYGSVALFLKAVIDYLMIRRQMLQIRDTEISMRNYGGMYREHGGIW